MGWPATTNVALQLLINKKESGVSPPGFVFSEFESGPAARTEVKVLSSALGALLFVDLVLFVARAADDIGHLKGAVLTYNGCCHLYSSEDRISSV